MAKKKNNLNAVDKAIIGAQKFLPKIMQPTPSAPTFTPPTPPSTQESNKPSDSTKPKSQPTFTYDGVTGKVTITGDSAKLMQQGATPKQALQQGKADIERIKGGRMTAEQEQQAQLQAQQNQELLTQAQLNPNQLSGIQGDIQGAEVDYSQALGAGAASAVPGVIGGAIGGATIGAVGGPIGAVGGALLGGIGAFLSGVRSNIKSQQVGEYAADQRALTKGDTYLRALISDTNKNPQNAPENIELFYKTLNEIDMAHAKTFIDSKENLNKFLGNDGTTQLANFEVFNKFQRKHYEEMFQQALRMPNPNISLITEMDLADLEQ